MRDRYGGTCVVSNEIMQNEAARTSVSWDITYGHKIMDKNIE